MFPQDYEDWSYFFPCNKLSKTFSFNNIEFLEKFAAKLLCIPHEGVVIIIKENLNDLTVEVELCLEIIESMVGTDLAQQIDVLYYC